ncbi:hypothetical protein ES332_A03G102800v1 [Gossypium tomentosum]|uniref:RING-type E3 ubiquitin transferase n=1 Tax=Gossypium tomentosum TaxID=34277 RepID=A0A5D2R4P6_GOSTO|nr:hypothetical protein ES332_A03G102800v1 [Gossypium tomentosum]
MNIGYANFMGREEQLGRWSLVDVNSSGTQNENLRLNAGLAGVDDNSCQVTERLNLHKPSGSENEQNLLGTGPEAFLVSSGSGGYVVDDNDSRPGCSYEGRRASCKRKALEGNVGQCSSSGNSGYFRSAESSAWHGISASYTAGSNVNISPPSRQVHPRLGLDVRGSASNSIPEQIVLPPTAESSHRNFHLRINPSSIQEPIAYPIFHSGDMSWQSVFSSAQQPSRLFPANHSLELRSAPVVHNANSENPNVISHVPSLLRNGGSGSRMGSSSNSNPSADRDVPRARYKSRSMARNILHHPMFVPAPELRTLVRNPVLSSGNISSPGNVASTSHAGSNNGANVTSASTWVPHPNPSSQYPQRLSELVRQALMSSLGTESGGQSNHSSLPSGPTTSPEAMLLSSHVASQVPHRPYPRSLPWLGRQDAGFVGIPHSLRTLAAATEGRSRLVVSEVHNVLDLMRRGENLRFEDVMILDQSVLLGVADIHDRHRDMRLDVDNMSYEELLALEEHIGNVSTGLSEETILNRLERRKYSSAPGAQLEAEPCCVCQEEYNDGEDIGTLECGHGFHADCIKQWLMHKNLCPICKTTSLTK